MIVTQEDKEKTQVQNEASLTQKSLSPVEKPQTTAAAAGPLYSGYALTPGIIVLMLLAVAGGLEVFMQRFFSWNTHYVETVS